MKTISKRFEDMEALLTLTQLAGILGIHRMTLYNWTKQGKIPAIRVGSRWKYDPAAVAGWIEARNSAS